ncbi:hypothetical protein [Dietzia cinnamea]|uniref:Uncharacterized protein n=2 Tax=Dietzia cinnamea TaxID=321318 RepID=A0A4R3ZR05_9ACTN|nr:hypothetical protein [Dietzia cinnamea]KZO58837.1 hypothetical protein A2U19_09905 [Dietzia maris]MCT1885763.1 hypothetical protein [Dietzia cinnamea]MCT2099020.1 hypothetical protein [Dietzia cinnamea]MCT2140633.1 hypothetical protein [Dietzia cinnamea]TCW21977.1 hypothetical protein EDD19_1216 [Dietzia cinnamea]
MDTPTSTPTAPTTPADILALPPGPLTAAELAAAVPDARDRDRYERIWHGLYRRDDQPDDLRLRSIALARTWPDGVLRGRSAALLWGDDSVPVDAPPEIWLPSTRRSRPGRIYRYGTLPPSAVTEIDGLRVTTPLRTCRDLAGDLGFEDAVVSVERLCARVPELPGQLAGALEHPSGRGARDFTAVARAADPRSGSAVSTRARLELRAAGLDGFRHGHAVRLGHFTVELPLADPDARCVVFAAGDSATPSSSGRGTERFREQLLHAGWTVIVARGDAAPGNAASLAGHHRAVDSGAGRRAAAVLRARWPSSEVCYPPADDPAADPHGMWSGPRR